MSEQFVEKGKLVSITYQICDESGIVLEQSDFPVSYIHGGKNELIGGMYQAIADRCAGEEVELRLGSEQGFGAHDPDLSFTDSMANVPHQFRHVGAEVQM